MKKLFISLLLAGVAGSISAQTTDSTMHTGMDSMHSMTNGMNNTMSADSTKMSNTAGAVNSTMSTDSTKMSNAAGAVNNTMSTDSSKMMNNNTGSMNNTMGSMGADSSKMMNKNPTSNMMNNASSSMHNGMNSANSMMNGAMENAKNTMGQPGYASLPVLESYIPDAVLSNIKTKYTNAYDVTCIMHAAGQKAYVVRYGDAGMYKTDIMGEDGTVMPQ